MTDLLVSEDGRSYFINCEQKGDLLIVGAVYIAPDTASPLSLFDEEGANLVVALPPKATNQSLESIASNASFLIV